MILKHYLFVIYRIWWNRKTGQINTREKFWKYIMTNLFNKNFMFRNPLWRQPVWRLCCLRVSPGPSLAAGSSCPQSGQSTCRSSWYFSSSPFRENFTDKNLILHSETKRCIARGSKGYYTDEVFEQNLFYTCECSRGWRHSVWTQTTVRRSTCSRHSLCKSYVFEATNQFYSSEDKASLQNVGTLNLM